MASGLSSSEIETRPMSENSFEEIGPPPGDAWLCVKVLDSKPNNCFLLFTKMKPIQLSHVFCDTFLQFA